LQTIKIVLISVVAPESKTTTNYQQKQTVCDSQKIPVHWIKILTPLIYINIRVLRRVWDLLQYCEIEINNSSNKNNVMNAIKL
jgi:hypothetical protein